MRILATLSLAYGIVVTCLAPVFAIVAIRFESSRDLLLSGSMLLTGSAQWLYSSKTKQWLGKKHVADTSSLDTWLVYDAAPEQLVRHTLIYHILAGVASFFELTSLYYVSRNLNSLFYLSDFSSLHRAAVVLLTTSTLLLALPSLLFNLRTWNLTVVANS